MKNKVPVTNLLHLLFLIHIIDRTALWKDAVGETVFPLETTDA